MQGQVFERVWALCICKAPAAEIRSEGQKDPSGSTPQHFTVSLQEYSQLTLHISRCTKPAVSTAARLSGL